MLHSLFIENLAVIQRCEVELGQGLNVFTGETGAGKTILISAIGAVLGGRMGKDIIRTGEKSAQVTAVFSELSGGAKSALEDMGFSPEEDGTLMVTRTIRQDSSECRIGGRPATVSVLKALSEHLIDIHGQHDNARLLSSDYHLELIDSFGGLESRLNSYRSGYRGLLELRKKIDGLKMDESEKLRRIDLLEYQTAEIDKAKLTAGEEEEITGRLSVIRNSAKIAEALGGARELLNSEYSEEPSILDKLSMLHSKLSAACRYISDLQPRCERVQDMEYELSELSSEILERLEELEYSPREEDELNARISLIHALKVKYGSDIGEILSYAARCEEELLSITSSDKVLAELEGSYSGLLSEVTAMAGELSDKRGETAKRFATAVKEELCFLDMKSMELTVNHQRQELSETGCDSIEILISPNTGEQPRPLAKIASGGELARIMLAIKNVTAGDALITSVFDEVDTGVSGRAANKIGKKLHDVGKMRQVLSVTHLAQVAAYADKHLLIEKNQKDGRTFTSVYALSDEERVSELARIMSADEVGEAALLNAGELLKNARSSEAD